MADQWNGGQSGPGERWNVNMPAVIGVVFVFLVGVIVWVIAASGRGDEGAIPGSSIPTVTSTTLPVTSTIATTTPPPMPSTTVLPPTGPPTGPPTVPATVPPTAAPTPAPTAPPPPPTPAPTAAPPPPPTETPTTTRAPTTTTAPGGSGDLGVPGHPMQHPPCDGGYITVLASAIGGQATAAGLEQVLDRYDGSSYLRTDVTCSSLNPSSGGQPIYVVYFGPFPTSAEACGARDDGPDDAYVRRLSNDLGPDHSVSCPN